MDFLDLISNAIAKGGWAGYVVLLAGLIMVLLRRDVRTKGEMEDALAERDKRFEEMKGDRDDWRHTAESTLKSLEQLTEVMDSAQNRAARR